MDWLLKLAPTVASAFLGPLGGVAVSAVSDILGVSGATQNKIMDAIKSSQLTPDQITQIKELELKYQAEEAERGFKYAELEFKDRDSARSNNVAGGVQGKLFWLSLLLLCITLGSELWVLFKGLPTGLPDIITGRILGQMDAVAVMVLGYWYGTSHSSSQKSELLAQSSPTK